MRILKRRVEVSGPQRGLIPTVRKKRITLNMFRGGYANTVSCGLKPGGGGGEQEGKEKRNQAIEKSVLKPELSALSSRVRELPGANMISEAAASIS